MLINDIKCSFDDDVIYKMDRYICNSDMPLEAFECINAFKKQEALAALGDLCRDRDKIRICALCHHTELVIDDWVNDRLCLRCYNIRNNANRVKEILQGNV